MLMLMRADADADEFQTDKDGLERGRTVLQVYTMHAENVQEVVQVVIRESTRCRNAQRCLEKERVLD
jgi:hypothetical protein